MNKQITAGHHSTIDKFSHDVMIAQLKLLLTYAERFYQRRFMIKKITTHKILERLENILISCFNPSISSKMALPTVQNIAGTLNVSPHYLSSMLKGLTGQGTQQHVHDELIETAKEKMPGTQLSVSEIAYEPGFEQPKSFSKLFTTKTNLSPLQFRKYFLS
ncbi:MAG: helix-turn-helix transcriptional regulator [Ferruginibacter sp.]|nr:helix-turn-helix transcriptional regulator [Ferruginibacter sp.]